jgi:antitoxin PrlF
LEFFIDFYIIFDYFYEVRKSYGGFMETLEITSLSTKGQVVIPRNIRNQLNLDTGDKLIVVCDGSNILLKPILSPNLSEFKALVEETDKITNELATTPEKLSDFIKDNR